jgi:hypothetical protein
MKSQACASEVRWPDFAGTSSWQQHHVNAAICPVVIGEGQPCFAVTVDQRWLCGSEGERTFFNTMAAASRFLNLVKVPGHAFMFGPPQALKLRERESSQCFRLANQGLASCRDCWIGERSHALEAQEHARQDDCW